MNNFVASLKKFITNKNTVTILGTLVGIAILYFGYNWRINQQVEQISVVVAKQNIQPRTRITADMVETIQIAKVMYDKMMSSNTAGASVIRSTAELNSAFENGAYANINSLIPQGSVLIRNVNVVDRDDIPSSIFDRIEEEGQVPYAFSINFADTYGNAIMDNTYVNIYLKTEDETGKPMIGMFIKDVKVLAVLDSSGRDVFENTDESRTPSTLIFGVDEDLHLLLRKANYLDMELIPVPVVESFKVDEYEGAVEVTSSYLRQYIESRTVDVPEDDLKDDSTTDIQNITGEE